MRHPAAPVRLRILAGSTRSIGQTANCGHGLWMMSCKKCAAQGVLLHTGGRAGHVLLFGEEPDARDSSGFDPHHACQARHARHGHANGVAGTAGYGTRAELRRKQCQELANFDLPKEIEWSMFEGLDFEAMASTSRKVGLPKRHGS